MAVSDFALATLNEVKTWLNITTSNATRDTFIEGLIEDVTADIEGHTGREFVGRMYTEYYEGDGTGSLFVNHRPLNAISTLIDDPEREWDDTTEIIERDDYMIYREQGKIQLYNDESTFNFPDGGQNVKVEYHGGYSLLTINLNQNDRLDFDHGGSEMSIQIPRGEYDCSALASKIMTLMNDAAGTSYHACEFNGTTEKYTIALATSAVATLNLNFAGGANSAYSMATLLGWVKADQSGATTYTPATVCNPHIPRDIKRICIRLVAAQFNQSNYGDGRQGIRQERIGDYSITFEDVLKNDTGIKRTLGRYKLLSRLIG